jgi:hypothetical protein
MRLFRHMPDKVVDRAFLAENVQRATVKPFELCDPTSSRTTTSQLRRISTRLNTTGGIPSAFGQREALTTSTTVRRTRQELSGRVNRRRLTSAFS